MKKTLLSFSITVFLSICQTFAYSFEDNGIFYNILDDESVAVVNPDYQDAYSGDIVVPPSVEYNGGVYTVTTIGQSAFSDSWNLTSISFPNTITTIENGAFAWCDLLSSVTIPSSVTKIMGNPFVACGLKEMIVENGNKVYDSRDNCNAIIETATNTLIAGFSCSIIPKTVTTIGGGAFSFCYFENLVIPDNVTTIQGGAFSEGSFSLITMGKGVKSIGAYAFLWSRIGAINITDLEAWCNIEIGGPITYGEAGYDGFEPDCHLYLNGEEIKDLILPEGVTRIPDYAFGGFTYLTSVTMGDNIESIGHDAFNYCQNLNRLSFGKNLKTIGENAFSNCPEIFEIHIKDLSAWCNLRLCQGIFGEIDLYDPHQFYLDGQELTEMVIPEDVDSIGDYTFTGFDGLKSVIIGDNVKAIGDYAFLNCLGIKSITFGNGLTSIGNNAFENCSNISSINIGDGVTSIGDYAFGNCNKVNSIIIGDGVEIIGDYAFSGCSNLVSFTIGDGVKSIGKGAFYGCNNMNSFSIGIGLLEIGESAFGYCSSIESIDFGSDVETIGRYAFSNCSNLSSLSFGNRIKTIGDGAFYSCYSLPVEDGIRYVGTYLLEAVDKERTTYTIKEGVAMIQNGAFSGCANLTSLAIPNSVTTIGDYVFSGCINLEDIIIGEGVTSMGKNVFEECTSLPVIDYIRYADSYAVEAATKRKNTYTLREGTKWIGSHAFEECNKATSIIIPDGLLDVGAHAFSGCSALSSILIPNSVVYIGESAFASCSALSSISIPNSVVYIGECAFRNCSSLTTLSMSENVNYIGEQAFEYCSELSNIVLPEHLTAIKYRTFLGCERLESISFPNALTSIGERAFMGCYSLHSIILPNSVKSLEEGAFNNCSSLESVVLSNGITTIGKVFGGCSNIESLTIPEGIKRIEDNAFDGCCKKLKTLFIPNSITYIGFHAFNDASELQSVVVGSENPVYDSRNNCNAIIKTETNTLLLGSANTIIPEEIEEIFDYAFSQRVGLKLISIPSSVRTIGDNAFWNCDSLETVVLHEGLTSIGIRAFGDCTCLRYINMPNSVTQFGNNYLTYEQFDVFHGCTSIDSIFWDSNVSPSIIVKYCKENLKTFVFGENIVKVKKDVFSDCKSLTTISVPNSVVSIDDNAFEGCENIDSLFWDSNVSPQVITQYCRKNLRKVTFGEKIQEIASQAFSDCSALESAILPNNIASIGAKAFENCTSLSSLFIPNSVYSIGEGVFDGCEKLSLVSFSTQPVCVSENCNVFVPSPMTELYKSGNICAIDSIKQASIALFSKGVFTLVSATLSKQNGDEMKLAEEGKVQFVELIPSKKYSVTLYGKIEEQDVLGSYDFSTKPVVVDIECIRKTNLTLTLRGTADSGDAQIISTDFGEYGEGTEITIDGLLPGQEVSASFNVITRDGSKINRVMTFQTEPVEFEFDNQIGSTSFALNGMPSNIIDLTVEAAGFEENDELQSSLVCYGLDPNTIYSKKYDVITKEAGTITTELKIRTEELIFRTEDVLQGTHNARLTTTVNTLDNGTRFGYEWKQTDEGTVTHIACIVNNSSIAATLNGLSANDSYSFRPYYISDSGQTYYGEWKTFIKNNELDSFEPEIHTYDAQNVSIHSAQMNGYTLTGSDEVIEQGFEFWRDGAIGSGQTSEDKGEHQTVIADGLLISANVDNLMPRTQYRYCAFIKTANKTTYGEEKTFITENPEYNEYWVVFLTEDGDTLKSVMQEYATMIDEPEAPEKEGYSFIGWTPDVPEVMPDFNISFTATYKVNSYKITYYVGEEVFAVDELEYGAEIVLREYNPSDERYTFIEWLGERYITMPAHDIEYYASLEDSILILRNENERVDVYLLNGMIILREATLTDIQRLPKGVYIIGGKKVLVAGE